MKLRWVAFLVNYGNARVLSIPIDSFGSLPFEAVKFPPPFPAGTKTSSFPWKAAAIKAFKIAPEKEYKFPHLPPPHLFFVSSMAEERDDDLPTDLEGALLDKFHSAEVCAPHWSFVLGLRADEIRTLDLDGRRSQLSLPPPPAPEPAEEVAYPERPGRPNCDFYTRTGPRDRFAVMIPRSSSLTRSRVINFSMCESVFLCFLLWNPTDHQARSLLRRSPEQQEAAPWHAKADLHAGYFSSKLKTLSFFLFCFCFLKIVSIDRHHFSLFSPVFLPMPRLVNMAMHAHSNTQGSTYFLSEIQLMHKLKLLSLLEYFQGKKECSFYMKTGHCKFGRTCKFNHPEEYACFYIRIAILLLLFFFQNSSVLSAASGIHADLFCPHAKSWTEQFSYSFLDSMFVRDACDDASCSGRQLKCFGID